MIVFHYTLLTTIHMNGWIGTILHIDCDNRSHTLETPSEEFYKTHIGGKGLAGYYLQSKVTLPWHDASMPLLFFTGPLVDTPSPTSGRMTIMSRSPLTGTIGDTSVGGRLGTEIKRAGYDGIVITGKSEKFCGIIIDDGTIEFVDAESHRGLTIPETVRMLKGPGSTAVIGPAGEHGVLFSTIAIDEHFVSGRGGLGAVMGAKKIKFIHVHGSGKTTINNKEELKAAREQINRLISASPILKGEMGISEYGTGALYDLIQGRRMMPTNNFRKTSFNHAAEMNAYHYKKKYQTKKTGCAGCTILCKKQGKNGETIPEYETMSHFSALLDNSSIELVVEANRICNELGMDTISAAATLSCYAEIQKMTLSSTEIVPLLYGMASAESTGKELMGGSYRYAQQRDKVEASITVKKLELPAYDPRGAYGMALAYATSTRGGCHLRAYPISHEILRKPVATDRFTFSGKARIIKLTEDMNAVIDSLTACKFVFFSATLEEYARALFAVTGMEVTAQDLLKIGERIYYNERIMNAANGFSKKDDDLPVRFFTEEGSSGEGIEVPPINREEFLKAMDNYYKIRGLDKNGMPTEKKSKELGLKWKD